MKAIGQPAQTGGFITGADAIDAIAYAIKKAGGSTDGAKLAAILSHLTKFQTLGGPISFTPGAAQRDRAAVPRDRGQQQRGEVPRRCTPRRRSRTSTDERHAGRTLTAVAHARHPRARLASGPRRLARPSRASRRSSDVDLELAPGRGARPDRPERRRQDDARQPADRASTCPRAGGSTLGGTDITRWPPYRRGRAGLARTFQHGRLFRGLSVRENVEVAALGVGSSPREARRRAGELLELLGLADRAEDARRLLPHGDQRKLGVARALALRPRFVLMDEPAAGPARGRDPGVRRGRSARCTTDVRRRRPADRPQRRADHGGLRPRPRARPRRHARRRARRPRSARNLDVATAYLGAEGAAERRWLTPVLELRAIEVRYGDAAGRARPQPDARARRDRRPDRPQRRRASRRRCTRSWASSRSPAGEILLRGARAARRSPRTSRAPGIGARPRGPPHLRLADRRGEPAPRALGAALAWTASPRTSTGCTGLFPVVGEFAAPHGRARSRAASSSSSRSRGR